MDREMVLANERFVLAYTGNMITTTFIDLREDGKRTCDTWRRPFNPKAPPFRYLHVGAPAEDGIRRQRIAYTKKCLAILHQARVLLRLCDYIAAGARSNVAGDVAPIGALGYQPLVISSHQNSLVRTVTRRGMENDIGVV